MTRRLPRLVAWFVFLALLAVGVRAQNLVRVERVIDGDTVVLAGLGTVRLIGVDAPESVDPRQPVQAFGKEAASFLEGLVGGQAVRVEYDQRRTDPYSRTLAYLYLADGRLVNKEIISRGFGHAYVEMPFKFMADFIEAQRQARVARRGLWAAETTGSATAAAATSTPEVTVYVTRTGTKYHRDGCRSLSQSRIPMPLKDAAARYGACSICRPPTATARLPPTTAGTATTARPPTSTSSRQCAATTQRGTRCSRTASAGSAYCWQHGGIR